jgi:hypothetical protein
VRRVDVDELARRMVAVFQSAIPAYARLPESLLRGEIEEMARRNIGLFLRSMADDRPPSERELEPFCVSARERAAEGLPIEDLLRAYRLGGRLTWEALITAATEEEQATLIPGVTRVLAYIDAVSDAVTDAYLDERRHVVSDEERRVHELFAGLQVPGPLDPDTIELARRLAFPVMDRYVPFAIGAEGSGQVAASLRVDGMIAVPEGDRVTGLMAAANGVLPSGSTRAIGPPTPRTELAAVLDDLRLLVDVGRATGQSGDLKAADFVPELMLARSPHLGALIEEAVFAPLKEDLAHTLDVFYDAGADRRAAASALHVHPNTLDYRLRRIEEATGLKFSDPGNLVLMALAVRHRRLVTNHN